MWKASTMSRKKPDREVERVVQRVLLVPGRPVGKAELEAIFGEVLACVPEKTGASTEQLASHPKGAVRSASSNTAGWMSIIDPGRS
jgi:hypothetical protein